MGLFPAPVPGLVPALGGAASCPWGLWRTDRCDWHHL